LAFCSFACVRIHSGFACSRLLPHTSIALFTISFSLVRKP
jgi:hypothetical protein